jgi:hypothetical protein
VLKFHGILRILRKWVWAFKEMLLGCTMIMECRYDQFIVRLYEPFYCLQVVGYDDIGHLPAAMRSNQNTFVGLVGLHLGYR